MSRMTAHPRVAVLAGLTAWLIWLAWVTASSFTWPDDPVLLFDRALWPLPHWREALVRGVRGTVTAGAVAVAAWSAGGLAWRGFAGLSRDRLEAGTYRLGLGFALLSFAFLGLAGLGWYRPPVVVAVLALSTLTGLWQLRAVPWRHEFRRGWPASSWFDASLLGITLAAALMALLAACAPEAEYDALWYHLWLPVQWLDAGRPVDIVEEYIALYPLSWDLLFGAAYVIGGTVGARLVHFLCLPAVGAALWLLSRVVLPRTAPALPLALAITTPIVVWEATTAYVDLALAWYVALAGHALMRHDETRSTRWLVLGGLAMGMALAIKHLALIAFAVAGTGLVLRRLWVSRRVAPALRAAAIFGAVAVALPSPWYARAWLASGNPVFPDLYRVFGAEPPERWNDDTEESLRQFKARFGGPSSPVGLVALPWNMTVHAASFGGTIGPLFLVFIAALLLVPRAPPRARSEVSGRLLIVGIASVAYLALWASPFSSLQMRFVVPLVPWLALLAAAGAQRAFEAAAAISERAATGLKAVLLLLLAMNLPPFVEWHEPDRRGWDGWLTHVVRGLPAVVAGAESESSYLARAVPSYRAWRYINDHLSEDAKILTFSGGDHLYSQRHRLWSESAAALPLTWWAPAGQEEQVMREARRVGVTHVLIDRAQLRAVLSLSVTSPAMRECCFDSLYRDQRFVLYHLR